MTMAGKSRAVPRGYTETRVRPTSHQELLSSRIARVSTSIAPPAMDKRRKPIESMKGLSAKATGNCKPLQKAKIQPAETSEKPRESVRYFTRMYMAEIMAMASKNFMVRRSQRSRGACQSAAIPGEDISARGMAHTNVYCKLESARLDA